MNSAEFMCRVRMTETEPFRGKKKDLTTVKGCQDILIALFIILQC